jgi:hypothetical protein
MDGFVTAQLEFESESCYTTAKQHVLFNYKWIPKWTRGSGKWW